MKPQNLRTVLVSPLGAAIAGVLVLVMLVLVWSGHRFNRINVCVSCHEIFVDYDEYKPVGELSKTVEDYNPVKEFDPGLFNLTVGCAECHAYPYEEYKLSPHANSQRGVKPGCVGCHNPHGVAQVMGWKFFYINKGGMGESPFHAISNSLRDIPQWEELRVRLANRVRQQMVDEDSVKCKNCHKPESQWFQKIGTHAPSERKDKTCVQCHYNIVHKAVKWDDAAIHTKPAK